jgi:ubiquitin carboxyl-terminal hydrolase 34
MNSAIGTALFRTHLFPDLSVDEEEDDIIVPRIPLLNPMTRHTLADTIYYLVKDDETQYKAVLAHLTALVPYATIEDGLLCPFL